MAEISDCIFCNLTPERIIAENDSFSAIKDGFPVTQGHVLIIPKRHVADYFGLSTDELLSMNKLLTQCRDEITTFDPSVEGFNIGMNCGEVAGQTIFHCHVHLIPRRTGDVENPRGGIRHLIPGKGNY